jgi:cytochrome c
MTKFFLLGLTAAALVAAPIVAPDGTEIQKGGRTGPNLYGIVGKGVASDPDYAYGESLAALGATGAVWDEASLAAYTANPAEYLKTALGDPAAKSKMSFKLAAGAEDVAAYLAAVAQ